MLHDDATLTTLSPTLYTAPTAISAAGNTDIAFANFPASDDYNSFRGATNLTRKWKLPRPQPWWAVSVSAGSAAYTAALTLKNTSAVAGDEMELRIAMPASANATIEVRNLTSGGTLLLTVPIDSAVARTWLVRARFDGTNWATILQPASMRAVGFEEWCAGRNALALRGGVAFEGTAGSRINVTLTNQAIDTDLFSLVVVAFIPSSSSGVRGIIALGPTSAALSANDFPVRVDYSSGKLEVLLEGASTSDASRIQLANFVTNYGGKTVQIAVVRNSSGNPTLYLDRVAQATADANFGTPPGWQATITSTYLNLGVANTTELWTGKILSATPFNCALTSADVQEIVELGGAVPDRFKWGSQAFLVNESTWAGASGTTPPTGWVSFGINNYTLSGGELQIAAAGTFQGLRNNVSQLQLNGKRARMTFRAKCASGTRTLRAYIGNSGVGTGTSSDVALTTSWQTFTVVGVLTIGSAVYCSFEDYTGSGGTDFFLDDVVLKQLGAVVHLPLDDGGGPQARDMSTNELDADITSTGVTHALTAPIGTRRQIRKTYAHSDISSTGATTSPGWLPAGWIVREVQASVTTAFDASTTLDFGISGTNAKYASALAIATTGFKRADSLSLIPESASANTTIYVKKNQATTTGAIKVIWVIERIY